MRSIPVRVQCARAVGTVEHRLDIAASGVGLLANVEEAAGRLDVAVVDRLLVRQDDHLERACVGEAGIDRDGGAESGGDEGGGDDGCDLHFGVEDRRWRRVDGDGVDVWF